MKLTPKYNIGQRVFFKCGIVMIDAIIYRPEGLIYSVHFEGRTSFMVYEDVLVPTEDATKQQPKYELGEKVSHTYYNRPVMIESIRIHSSGVYYTVNPLGDKPLYETKEEALEPFRLKWATPDQMYKFQTAAEKWADEHKLFADIGMSIIDAISEWEANKIGLTIYQSRINKS